MWLNQNAVTPAAIPMIKTIAFDVALASVEEIMLSDSTSGLDAEAFPSPEPTCMDRIMQEESLGSPPRTLQFLEKFPVGGHVLCLKHGQERLGVQYVNIISYKLHTI